MKSDALRESIGAPGFLKAKRAIQRQGTRVVVGAQNDRGVGAKLRGSIGAISAVAGFIVVPWTVGLSLGGVVLRYAEIAVLQNILGGLSASAAGLMIGTGLRLLTPRRSRRTALLFAGLAFAAMAFTRLPLVAVLIGLAPLSILVTALESPRTH